MEKKPLQSKQHKLQKNERWTPYIRYQKETDTWITKAIREERSGNEKMEGNMEKIIPKIRILMERKDLDIIARITAYIYHDKKNEYMEIASDSRKEHIYKDLKNINEWLNIQYQRLKAQDEQNKNLNKFDLEIINEQSK